MKIIKFWKKKRTVQNKKLQPWLEQQAIRKKEKPKKQTDLFDGKLIKLTEQRKKALRQQALFPLIFFSVMTLVTLVLILPISRVSSVTVNSTDKPLRTAVIKASGLHYYESLFVTWFSADKIEQKIENNVGLVKTATLRYVNINKIVIDIKEYATVGYVYRDKKYYRLSSTGQTLSVGVDNVTGSYPVFYNFKNQKKLKLAVEQLGALSTSLRKSVSEIHYSPTKVNPNRVKIYMNDGNEIIGDLTNLAKKMAYYPKITANMDQKGVVDLEVGAYSYPYN